jgi:uncharacterized protein (DUF305 family)
MRPSSSPAFLTLTLALAAAACGGGPRARAGDLAAYEAAAQRHRPPVNPADVRFMTGMIPHHAQAVLFAGWAQSHRAGRAVTALCERIVVGQSDEIATMRNWLRDHGQPVPAGTPESADTRVVGMQHDMMMPGMLDAERLTRLDAARGDEFDRLFLLYMIPHHQGALTMVDTLFASYGGAQDDFVYKLASDIYADQTIEIARMQKMLAAVPPDGRTP